MTDKELLYVEDALAHAKHFDALCEDACQNIQDGNLKAFVTEVQKEVQLVYNNLFTTLKW